MAAAQHLSFTVTNRPQKSPQPSYRALRVWAEQSPASASRILQITRLLIRFLYFTSDEFVANSLSLRAAALTYTVLLSLVPILAMSTAVVKGLGGDTHLRQAAYGYLDSLGLGEDTVATPPLPGELEARSGDIDLGSHLRTAVDQLFAYVDRTDFAALGSLGVIGILVSVILVLGTIEEAMNVIWKADGGRSFGRRIADYLTVLVLLPISINLTFAAGALLENPTLLERLGQLAPLTFLQPLLLKMVPLGLTILTFFVIYLFFPNTKVRLLPALLGAGIAAYLWTVTQNLYLSLQLGVANYNTIYGSFATLPLFLIWLYLGWLFILGGAQLAYAWQNLPTSRPIAPSTSPADRLEIAFAIFDAIANAHGKGQKLAEEDLVDVFSSLRQEHLGEVVGLLEETGVLHRSNGDRRLLPGTGDRIVGYRQIALAVLGGEEDEQAPSRPSRKVIAAAVRECEKIAGQSPPSSP